MTTAAMKLSGFRVTNFRSVEDSGWIETDEIASLIGTNESGKTNLLVPLWKLKPAKDGGIKLLTDAPRKSYNKIREQVDKPRFITARFEITKASVAQEVAAKVGLSPDRVKVVEVSRDFSGKYHIHFPDGQPIKSLALEPIVEAIQSASDEIGRLEPSGKGDESLKESVQGNVTKALKHAQSVGSEATRQTIKELKALLPAAATENAPARSTIAPRYGQLLDLLDAKLAELSKTNPDSVEGVAEVVVKHMPAFVYYSTYGNLDSEIYLPHVIANLERKDISGREEARARTLRVLFDFVRLKPNEILELGKDVNPSENPTDDVVKAFAEKKKERSVLMQSAGTELTKSFRDWWKQGEYRIRFEADGNHFRIWISDDQRPEEIELEGRSTGLQWFLSFYLIFLVESQASHTGCVLLLDEPGISLHPIAQRDLALFFENLASSNQLIYTTHSPFLVDADHLERVRSVFVDDKGLTVASSNLRAGTQGAQSKSVYPVHAALGISVSDTLFIGCAPVVVEGQSDQLYLSAMKSALIGRSKIHPERELVFVPGSGVKSVKTIASILSGPSNELPHVLCDSDNAGNEFAKALKSTLYANEKDKVLQAGQFSSASGAEIEDLFPRFFIDPIVDRFLRGPQDHEFKRAKDSEALVPAIEAYAAAHDLSLPDGWKVELAKTVKAKLVTTDLDEKKWTSTLDKWTELFEALG